MNTAPGPATMKRFEDPERVEVTVGERFAVVLSGNGVGGYLWRPEELPAALRLHGERDLAPASAAPGAAGAKEFELEATTAGTSAARFALRRDWEAGAARTRDVAVHAS